MASSDREGAELMRGLYRNIPVVSSCVLVGIFILCAAVAYAAPDRLPQLKVWLAISAAITAWQVGLWIWRKRAPGPDSDWRRWGHRLTAAAFVDGARWGFGSIWIPAAGNFEQQQWVCMVVGGAACAQVGAIGAYPPAFYTLLATAMLPYFAYAGYVGDPQYIGVAALGAILSVAIGFLSHRQSRTLREALRLRYENMDLAEGLRAQKELAEQANLAKTQFLAAASHDLRQPMHALGMFVAALGRVPLPSEGERLTRQIAETVDAMGGLFAALLDISQLDAGMIRPERRAFAIGPMLARLAREQAGELERRPVALRLVDTDAFADTDPVLLERMLRNLIANAVRHTPEGRVLVGCRRSGRRLRIEVWDTGPGIAPAHQAQVFEEYFQVGNPERDRTKGLGLGLAITRRLSALIDCPVTLRSEAGRGSVFAVDVPRAGAPPPAVETTSAPAPSQGLVFVVDDELLIQRSMAELLDVWGYEVVAAASGDELLARADPARTPDLVICDWRLRDNEQAPEVIARVRAAYGAEVPALLITGDTAPERLRAAHDTGAPLLHKPVAPGKLRAALGNLIARRSPEAELVR